ncbi:MAG: phosphate ABC transporter substrate-binding protein [Planctomycetes bacterium]|nr:phosphate ABC transporter substrate-binding protein [Planctomycetota bacterium]
MERAKTVLCRVATAAALMAAIVVFAGVAGCGKSQGEKELGATAGSGGSQAKEKASTVIQNCGSDTMVNLAQMWAEEYRKVEPTVSVEVSGGGSGVGISNLMKGLVTIANASRDMTESEREQTRKNTGKDPVEVVVGYDAIAIYAHKDNPVQELTMADLAGIYGEDGHLTKWSQLGITVSPDEIVVVSRQNSSGTYAFFREHVLNKKRFRSGMPSMAGSKDVVDLVGKTLGAIGYSGMGYKTDDVKFVNLSAKKGEPAYAPTLENVRDKHYALARTLNIYTLGQAQGEVKKYIDWILSPAGQDIVRKAGYIAVDDLKSVQ